MVKVCAVYDDVEGWVEGYVAGGENVTNRNVKQNTGFEGTALGYGPI